MPFQNFLQLLIRLWKTKLIFHYTIKMVPRLHWRKIVSPLAISIVFLSGQVCAKAASIIGVSYEGDVVSIDEFTGIGTTIGFSGFKGFNSLARNSSGTLFAATDSYFGFGRSESLVIIDQDTGVAATAISLNFYDQQESVRGLAFAPNNNDTIYVVQNGGGPGRVGINDSLFTININSGEATLRGNLSFSGVQGLDFSTERILYGWDVDYGLLVINPLTGIAQDVNPFVGGTVHIQSLAFSSDGSLYGAGNALYKIDLTTGIASLVGSGSYSDLRGIEFLIHQEPKSIPEPATKWEFLVLTAIGVRLLRKQIKTSLNR